MLGQRHGQADLARQLWALTQEEEQQIEHDAEAHQKFEGALTKAERLAGQDLAALGSPLGDLVAQAIEITHAHAIQAVLGKCRQHVLAAFDVACDIQLAALDTLVERGAFLHQQGTGDDHR
ncbi:hypothetical protein D3C76_1294020 [compost metagenome]